MPHKAHIERPLILTVGLLSLAALGGCGSSKKSANHASTSASTATKTVVAGAGQTRVTTTKQTASTSSGLPVAPRRVRELKSMYATYDRCMRTHGIDMPSLNPNRHRPVIYHAHINFNSPAVKHATALCTPAAEAALRSAEAHAGGR